MWLALVPWLVPVRCFVNILLRLQSIPDQLGIMVLPVPVLKPAGGVRPVGLVEELLNAVEFTMFNRVETVRHSYPQRCVFDSCSWANEKYRGAEDVAFMDQIVSGILNRSSKAGVDAAKRCASL